MTRLGSIALLWLIGLFSLISCREEHPNKEVVHVAVAANMQFTMEDVVEEFTAKTGVPCELIIGSSGKLTAQIKEGAPFDIFVSADMKYPEDIAKNGMAALPPRPYADGALALWTMSGNITPTLDVLDDEAVRHIALANPKTAPYGEAAAEVLEHIGLLEKLREKLVYGESIAQTNQFIISGSAEIGFTALSVVLSDNMAGRGKWIGIPRTLHRPVTQGVVLLKKEQGPKPGAKALYDFLLSDGAGKILEKFGYSAYE